MTFQHRLGRWLLRIRPAFLAAWLKTLLRIRRFPHPTPHGTFWVDPASYQGLCVLDHGEYEPGMISVLRAQLQPGDTFVDLGANEGYFSVIASAIVGPAGRVLAIEPQGRLQPVLRENFRLNTCANVTLAQVAVSDHAGEATLHLTAGVNNSASGLHRATRYGLPTETVPTARLATVLDQHGVTHCRLLKMDVESWEYEAIFGSEDLFRSGRIRSLAVEIHPDILAARGLDPARISAFLASCGYQPKMINGHSFLTLDS